MSDRTDALKDYRTYTLTELEPIIGVHHRTLMRYVTEGKLKAVKVGGKWRVTEANVKAFLTGQPQE